VGETGIEDDDDEEEEEKKKKKPRHVSVRMTMFRGKQILKENLQSVCMNNIKSKRLSCPCA
jgi:hypothetical protein